METMIAGMTSSWKLPFRVNAGDGDSRINELPAGDRNTAPGSKSRAQRGAALQISEEDVFKVACNYEGYTNEEFDPELKVRAGIANTLDITAYEVSPDLQKELYREEIVRLSSAVAEGRNPRTFTGSPRLASDTQEAYEIMTSLSNQMWMAFNIIMYDSEILLRSHCPDLHHEELMKHNRMSLKFLTKPDGDDIEGNDDENGDEEDHKESMFPILDYEGNREDYFELVNYTTEIISRVLLKCAHGRVWHEGVLACMAKLSAKMKVLSANLEEFASISLSQTPATLKQSTPNETHSKDAGDHQTRRNEPMENLGAMLQSPALKDLGGIAGINKDSKRHAAAQLYWADVMMFQRAIRQIFQPLLLTLRGVKRTKATSTTSYELCAMVYDTGFEDFPTMVYQDLNGEYVGSSKLENINISQSVFEVLHSAIKDVEELSQNHRPPHSASGGAPHRASRDQSDITLQPSASLTPANRVSSRSSGGGSKLNTGVGSSVSWSYIDMASNNQSQSSEPSAPASSIADHKPKVHYLKSMNEVLTIIVPLIILNPVIIAAMTDYVGLLVQTTRAITENDTRQVHAAPGTKFKAFFSLTTHDYINSWKRNPHSACSQLSKSLMTQDKLVAGKASEDIPKGTLPFAVTSSLSDQRMKNKREQFMLWEQEISQAKKKMNEWVFEETGVRVSCGLYVWGVLTVAATLVAGGIVSGLTIQERIKGVDPFNIATFTWVIAGFIILIAKSTRVGNWSWRDFLHRQVLCRSVSELHYVTGIDYQLILAKLLHEESTNRLKTRGPYNCVFTNRTDDADGFSIDKPLSIRTMLLSGLVMIQVQAPYYGEFLVCLDVRKGKKGYVIEQHSDPRDENASYIFSSTVPDFSLSENAPRRISLSRGSPEWNRVIGVYGRRDCFFT
ncbi:hypothetical protein F5X98DRAFT_390346 [Xylaria grammica]|nr:hypothetical protein F5X98DRAFT_390346 [Xylaria grammica]